MTSDKSRKISEIHSAKAAMAGFLFQIRRALNRLAGARTGTHVSIETLDDVVVENADNSTIVEQDKLSFLRNPIPDRSENLWKTLVIWMGLIKGGEVNVELTEFHLVSTFPIKTGVAAMLKLPSKERDNEQIVASLLNITENPGEEIIPFTTQLAKWPRSELVKLIQNITVTDQSCEDSKSELIEKLNLDASIKDDVVRGLSGWLVDAILDHFVVSAFNREEALPFEISAELFARELNKLIYKHFNGQIVLRASREIVDPKKEDIDAKRDARFVKQLQLLAFGEDENELILESILDFIKAEEETTRLAKRNEITKSKFRDYEDSLRQHWKHCRREAKLSPLDSEELTGQKTLNETIRLQAFLDGQPVLHSYLTRGTYHALANRTNIPELGWHPRFSELL